MRTFTLWYGPVTLPEGDLDGVAQVLIGDRLSIHLKHAEMNLVDVEGVGF